MVWIVCLYSFICTLFNGYIVGTVVAYSEHVLFVLGFTVIRKKNKVIVKKN